MTLNEKAENLRELFNVPSDRTKILDPYWRKVSLDCVDYIEAEGTINQNKYLAKMIEPCLTENERLLAVYHAGKIIEKIITSFKEECDCPACKLRRKLENVLEKRNEQPKTQSDSTQQYTGIKINKDTRRVPEMFGIPKEREEYLDHQVHAILLNTTIEGIKKIGRGVIATNLEGFAKINYANNQELAYIMWVCGFKCHQAKMINADPVMAATLMIRAGDL